MIPKQSTSLIGEGTKVKSQWSNWPTGAVFIFIAALTFIAYLPAISGDFLWDDAGHVTNASLQSWSGLSRIWFEIGATQQYYPLLHTAFWIEHRIWGDMPEGYHLITILWHVMSATLLVALLRRLSIPGALLAGLIFALHPVCVESVAWISEQKNTLSTVFYLASVLSYLSFEENKSPSRYVFATIFFVAALLTKSITATLPMALLVIAWWRRGKISWRNDVVHLVPWLLCGIVVGLTTSWFESTQIGAKHGDVNLDVLSHILLASRIICFYVGKLLCPTNLAFFYPHWKIDPSIAWQWIFPAFLVTYITLLVVNYKWQRSLLAVTLLFCGTLFPVLGFINVYPFIFSYVADHFQYQASMWAITLLAASLWEGIAFLSCSNWIRQGSVIVLITTLGWLTWLQCGMYRNLHSLYETTLERNQSSWIANLNFGIVLDEEGETEKSLSYLNEALAQKPGYPETLNSLGNVLNKLGRSKEALPLLEQAVKLEPHFAAAYNSLGSTLMSLGRTEDGIISFRRAVDIDSTWTLARINLGWALANCGKTSLAIEQFKKALSLQPNLAEAEAKWGLTLVIQQNIEEALYHLKRAVVMQPDDPELHYSLGRVCLIAGQRESAIDQFQATLQLDQNHAGARDALSQLTQAGFIVK
jgi:protein O-mannosyl-transferase